MLFSDAPVKSGTCCQGENGQQRLVSKIKCIHEILVKPVSMNEKKNI